MKTNLGNTDKIIRLLASAVIAVLYFANLISGTTAIVLLIVSVILVATSFISFCPLYFLFGTSTIKKGK